MLNDSEYITFAEFRRYKRNALVGFLVLLAGLAFALSTKPDVGALRAGDISACRRVNILRAQSNISDQVSFNILSIAGQRETKLAQIKNRQAPLHRDSAAALFAQADQLTITELTKCDQAVDHARTYRFPIASPIGDPRTGEKAPQVVSIIAESRALLNQNKQRATAKE